MLGMWKVVLLLIFFFFLFLFHLHHFFMPGELSRPKNTHNTDNKFLKCFIFVCDGRHGFISCQGHDKAPHIWLRPFWNISFTNPHPPLCQPNKCFTEIVTVLSFCALCNCQNYSTSNVSYQFDTRTIHSKHSGLKMHGVWFSFIFYFIPALPYLTSMEEWHCIISLHIIQMYVEVISFLRLCFGGYNQHQGQWGSHSFIRDPCCCRSWVFLNISAQEYFFLKAHPAVSLHFPPCGWQRTKEQPVQGTTVWAWLKMVVIL